MVDFSDRIAVGNNRVIKEEDRRSLRALAYYLAYGLLSAALLLFYCWEQQQIIDYGYKIEELKRQRQLLFEINRSLALERDTLRSPQRIDGYARQNLGLIDPNIDQVIFGPGAAQREAASLAGQLPELQPVASRARKRVKPENERGS